MNLDTIHKIDTHIDTLAPEVRRLVLATVAADMAAIAEALSALPKIEITDLVSDHLLAFHYIHVGEVDEVCANIIMNRVTVCGASLREYAHQRGVGLVEMFFDASFRHAEAIVNDRVWASVYKSIFPIALGCRALTDEQEDRLVMLVKRIVAMVGAAEERLVRDYPDLQSGASTTTSMQKIMSGLAPNEESFALVCRLNQLFDLGGKGRIAEVIFRDAFLQCGWPTWCVMAVPVKTDFARAERIRVDLEASNAVGAWVMRYLIDYVRAGRLV